MPHLPDWAVMWASAVLIYGGCKLLTLWHYPPCSRGRLLGYLFLWPGMDAPAFLTRPAESRPTPGEWAFALVKFVFGLLVLFAVARQFPADWPVVRGWVGLVGIAFVLHFGLFHLMSCGWRFVGVEAAPLMDWPVLARNVTEFWGRRWNAAFRDLTHRFLFRPLTPRLGAKMAMFVVFGFSGLVHDAVISLPVGVFGGPTLFFLVQALALIAERSAVGRRLGLRSGWRGRLFATAVLLGPAPLLFHRPFVEGVVLPFMSDLGAL